MIQQQIYRELIDTVTHIRSFNTGSKLFFFCFAKVRGGRNKKNAIICAFAHTLLQAVVLYHLSFVQYQVLDKLRKDRWIKV